MRAAVQPTGPLDGLVVMDFSLAMAGPLTGQKLGDLGAKVIKIEPTGSGEWHRTRAGGGAWVNQHNASFLAFNRNKESLAVNLKTEPGREVVYRIAKQADVALLNYRPGVATRLGVDYESLSSVNPQLVYCSISGYGETGPNMSLPGQDLLLQGMSGALFNGGRTGDPPTPAPFFVADATGSHLALEAILAALLHRERTGVAQKVEVNLLSGMIDMQVQELSIYLNGGVAPTRTDEPRPTAYYEAPVGIYKTADGYIAISVGPPELLGRVLSLVDPDRFVDEIHDPAAKDEFVREVGARLRERTTAEWLEKLRAADYWAGPVYDYEDLIADPQVVHNETFIEMHHPTEGNLRLVGFPWRFQRTPASARIPHPAVGEHTRAILQRSGYTADEIDELARTGAVEIGHAPGVPANAERPR